MSDVWGNPNPSLPEKISAPGMACPGWWSSLSRWRAIIHRRSVSIGWRRVTGRLASLGWPASLGWLASRAWLSHHTQHPVQQRVKFYLLRISTKYPHLSEVIKGNKVKAPCYIAHCPPRCLQRTIAYLIPFEQIKESIPRNTDRVAQRMCSQPVQPYQLFIGLLLLCIQSQLTCKERCSRTLSLPWVVCRTFAVQPEISYGCRIRQQQQYYCPG